MWRVEVKGRVWRSSSVLSSSRLHRPTCFWGSTVNASDHTAHCLGSATCYGGSIASSVTGIDNSVSDASLHSVSGGSVPSASPYRPSPRHSPCSALPHIVSTPFWHLQSPGKLLLGWPHRASCTAAWRVRVSLYRSNHDSRELCVNRNGPNKSWPDGMLKRKEDPCLATFRLASAYTRPCTTPLCWLISK